MRMMFDGRSNHSYTRARDITPSPLPLPPQKKKRFLSVFRYIYLSLDKGGSWSVMEAASNYYAVIASSSTGSRLIAAQYTGNAYTHTLVTPNSTMAPTSPTQAPTYWPTPNPTISPTSPTPSPTYWPTPSPTRTRLSRARRPPSPQAGPRPSSPLCKWPF